MKETHTKPHERSASTTTTVRDWRFPMRRRWPVAAGIVFLLLMAILMLARRGHGEKSTDTVVNGDGARAREREVIDSVVTLDSTSLGLADIAIAPVGAFAGSGLVANGTITYDANRVSVIAPRTEGRVIAVRTDLGAQVSAGAVLALVESREVGQTRGELARARANLDVAQNNYEREKRLYEQSISSQKEMLEAQGAYKTALAEYDGASAQITGLGAQGGQGSVYSLTSPLGGAVVERNAMPGQIVGPSTNLFTVADLRHVWISVDVYEGDVARVRQGAAAEVSPRALPDETFRGRVTYAGGVVDTASRTLKVRVEVENPGLRLRPGMFAQVRIAAPAVARQLPNAPIVIPDLAVQDLNGAAVVFVPSGGAGHFVARHVTVGPRAGAGLVTIISGLRIGDSIVIKGAFQLKAELTKGSFAGDES